MRRLTTNNNYQVVVDSDKENGGNGNASATEIRHFRMMS